VRCSSCESHLSQYIERTLPPLRARAVATHLRTCEACEALHRRLRNVDGLLHTASTFDLHDEFTKTIMAHVSELPPTRPRRRLWLPAAGMYLVCAWIVLALAYAFMGPDQRYESGALLAAVGPALTPVALAIRSFWPIAPIAVPIVVAILIVDAALLAAIFLFYRAIRPRLVAAVTTRESA